MTRTSEIPGSVRIRTGDGNEWRYDAIEAASRYYDANRSDAVAYACEDVTGAVAFVEDVLGRDDLTVAQRQELAEAASKRLEGVDVEVVDDVRVAPDE
ncbi:hypothetical protein G9C85_00125 [Halorubellus sp. JP-L1]|uniref:DUF7692 domain-containing protein n=1 Tax=Halorubellus sp. JP-L1 TaxID=2715753 RepID=UPI00140AAA26|nr:hypothetical protein [Halorubellus sp. JP-L1]NHN40044.1 hypothetical protein [Halorubellus sp. JP-L1]